MDQTRNGLERDPPRDGWTVPGRQQRSREHVASLELGGVALHYINLARNLAKHPFSLTYAYHNHRVFSFSLGTDTHARN